MTTKFKRGEFVEVNKGNLKGYQGVVVERTGPHESWVRVQFAQQVVIENHSGSYKTNRAVFPEGDLEILSYLGTVPKQNTKSA